MNKKGFTLIELLTVIAILGILVLIAAPKFLGYIEKANIAKIQTGIKSMETVIDLNSMDNPELTKDWRLLTQEEIQEINDSEKLINRKGLVKNDLEDGAKYIPLKKTKDFDSIKWKSDGDFILDVDGESVYYYNKDIKISKGEDGSATIPEDGGNENPTPPTVPTEPEIPAEPEITYPITHDNGDKEYEDGTFIKPDGTVIKPDGTIIHPNGDVEKDGTITKPDGTIIKPDGTFIKPDGTILHPNGDVEKDGTITKPDGTIIHPNGDVEKDGTITKPDGTIVHPNGDVEKDGTITKPDGTILHPNGDVEKDGTITKPDGTIIHPNGDVEKDGTITKPDGTIIHPNGDVESPDGTITKPDGTIIHPNGDVEKDGTITKPDGTIIEPDGTTHYPNGDIKDKDGNLWTKQPDGNLVSPDGSVMLPDGTVIPVAKDSDFTWTAYSYGYAATGQSEKGYYKYTGTGEEVVNIPHVINGTEMTSYSNMFSETGHDVKKVISTNPKIIDMGRMFYGSQATSLDLSLFDTSNVTNMSGMFYGSRVTSLDLSSFDTSNVTTMSSMFSGSQATILDLSSFDTSNVTNIGYIFYSSKATTGYARTQADADKFNTSSDKPTGLTFTTK